MSLASLEYFNVLTPEDDPFAHVYSEHIPRVGEYVAILLKKGEGYKQFIVREIEYLHDMTRPSYRDCHMTSVAIKVSPVS